VWRLRRTRLARTLVDPRYTLLVVDDEQPVLDVLVRSFSGRFNVLTARSAAEALTLLRAQKPDVLITDQRIPDMTGLELVRAARAEGLDTTAILLTGFAPPEELVEAINENLVFRYVAKPWELTDLLIAVKNAVEITQLKRDKERLLSKLKKSAEAQFVLYEASHQTAGGVPTYDAIIDRVLSAVAPVLPYDCGAALVVVDENQSAATLRMRCTGVVGDEGLVTVKETVLSSHRNVTGQLVPEDKLITSITGSTSQDVADDDTFASQLTVPLVSCGRQVGTLSLFSRQKHAYTGEDGEMLDVLANQTTDAILALRASEEESRHRTERMVESMADGVILTDEKHRVVVLNPTARQMLRLPDDPAEWTSKNLQARLGFTPFDVVRRWELGGAQVLREELKIFDRTLQSTVSPVADSRGTLRGVCVILRDISEQKQLEERKDELVSIISHELRTPLTSISGALDLVLNRLAGEINEKQQRYLSMAKESTDKLDAIVDDLLDISKFAKGRLRMNFELTRLDDIVRRAVDKYGPVMVEKGLRLRSHVPNSPLLALASPNRMGQVLNNLLTNAVKFTPEHGEVELELYTSSQVPGFAVVCCWNSGEGIPEGDLERIFEKFEQARSERTRTVRGTGLGLAISRSIVEAHGGRIWAEPCEDGARFVAVLPLEPPPELLQPGGVEVEKPQKQMNAPTVLVVEEEFEVAYVVKALLMEKGYRVRLATSADDGMAQARKHRPDVTIIASRLPGQVDGFGLTEILRSDSDTRTSQVVLMAGVEDRQRAFRLGATGFLPKPIPPDRVTVTVEAVLKGRGGKKRGRLLVVDRDTHSISLCKDSLEKLGFDVASATSFTEGRKAFREARPDLLLMDLASPDGDTIAFAEELNAERSAGRVPVIFLSDGADSSLQARALSQAGDELLEKPLDALELVERVERLIDNAPKLGASPTTQLPGSAAIEREVQRRVQQRKPFAFCSLDLDNLKAYNDYYGTAKADGVVRQTGDLLREILAQEGKTGDFLGHVAGEDFVLIIEPDNVDAICRRATEAFDRIIPLYYDKQDRERGFIEAEGSFGERRRYPFMTMSIVAVTTEGRTEHSELSRRVVDLKKELKQAMGSVYLRGEATPPIVLSNA